QGAAAVAVELHNLLQYPSVKRLFYFSPIEGYKPEEIFSGDLGLLTVNYHRKAMYNLFQMISYLGERRLSAQITGENTEGSASYALATQDAESGSIAVLAWNYWDQARTLDLSVSALPYREQVGNFRVTRYLIDADHANYYRDYSAGLRGYEVGPTEALIPVEDDVYPATDTFFRRVSMSPHSVTLFVLESADRDAVPGVISTPSLGLYNHAAAKAVEASSTLNIEGWERERLVDGITHSLPNTFGWSSELYGTPEQEVWVQVDLGQPAVVDAARLHPRDDYEYEGAGFPLDFVIQGAVEPDQWIDLVGATGYDPGEIAHHVQTFEFTPGRYRYIRLLATRLGAVGEGGYALQLAELEVIEESKPVSVDGE
ncbi:MAG: discoidin domain-containing protein, partial [Anaerolineae bacterium]